MKSIFASILFLLFTTTIQAQKPLKLDSLKNVLAHLPAEGKSFAGDTLRVRVLCEMGEEYFNLNNDSVIVASNSAIKIADRINFKSNSLKLYKLLGRFYLSKSIPTKSSEYFFKGIALAEELKLNDDLMYFVELAGGNYLDLGDYKNALKYFTIHSNMCLRLKKADQYFMSLINIGIVYFNKKEFKKSLYYFQKCKQESKIANNTKLQNAASINVAKVFVEMGKLNEALTLYKSSLKINDGYVDKIAFVSNEISQIYFIKKKYEVALYYSLIALKNTRRTAPNTLKEVSLTLSKIYRKTGNLKESFKHYKTYTKITIAQDSIKNTQLVKFLNLDYKNEKQSIQIKDLNDDVKQKELRNKILLLSILGVLFFLLLVIYFNNSLKKQNTRIENQNKQIEALNLNLEEKVKIRTVELLDANNELIKKNFEITEALFKGQSQERKRLASELHDNLGGTLSAIKWRLEALNSNELSLKEKKIYEGIKEMMKNAYSEVRNISHNLLPVELENNNIVGAIQKLINNINDSEKIIFNFILTAQIENIDKKTTLAVYSHCLELINNIIKHSKATIAVIELKNVEDKLVLIIKDNGIGFSLNNHSEGFGLSKINERMKELNSSIIVSKNQKWSTVIEISYILRTSSNIFIPINE